jgi:glutathione S-transferase
MHVASSFKPTTIQPGHRAEFLRTPIPGDRVSMIVVHHLDHSRSHRILWLLEELGVEYEVVAYRRDRKTMLAPPELTKIHPLGKSPVITEGENTIAESGAIIEYLVEKYGGDRLAPARGTPSRLRYTYWLHYAEGSAMPLLLMKLVLQRIPTGAPVLIRPIARLISRGVQTTFVDSQFARHIAFWNAELSRTPWFASSELTAADIQMSYPVEAAESRFRFGDKYPAVSDFLARIRARPAYRRAIERGGDVWR